jgi:vacuolar-type H+-ATPase subunit H
MSPADRKSGTASDSGQFDPFGTAAWEQMTEASRKLLDTAATMSREIFDFATARLTEDITTQQKLLQAKSFEEMQKVYAEFFQNASRQYLDEMQKLMSMATNSVTGTARSATRPAQK